MAQAGHGRRVIGWQCTRHQEIEGRTGGRCQSHPFGGDRPASCQGLHTACSHGEASGRCSLAARGRPTERPHHAKKRTRSRTAEADLQQQLDPAGQPSLRTNLLHARPENEGSTCPINATVFALLWQVVKCSQEDNVPSTWHLALSMPTTKFASTIRFQLMGWQRLHTQHDVAEFAPFPLPRIRWISTQDHTGHVGASHSA